MTFLAPLFLLGLAALAVPIVLHLMHRERPDAVAFPSLMFLKRIPHKSVRRRRLRDKLLLALRALALILLAAAFARPFVDRVPAAGAALAPARDIVLLLDRSYSMGYGDHWARALEAARATIAGMRPDDRAAVVVFDERAHVLTEQTGDAAVLRTAVDTLSVGPQRTQFGPALRAAQSLLDASERPQREVVLISDFQQGGWDADAASRLEEGVALTTVPVATGNATNTLLAGVSIARERFEARERVRLTARIAHRGTSARQGTVTFLIDGRTVQTMAFEAQAGDVVDVTFPPYTLEAGAQRATVRLNGDALSADDEHHLVLSAAQPVRVLLVDGRGAGAPASLYVRRALAVGESPAFQVQTSDAPSAGELAAADVVLLNGAPWPTGAAGERLAHFIEQGGGVLTVLGSTGSAPDAIARVAGPVDRAADGGAAIGFVEYAHAALELFREPRNGDLGSASHYRYRATQPAPGTRVLARFDDGSPALLEAPRGAGRVLVATSTMDTYWSDLPLQPVFVPLLHRLVAYAADWHEQPAALTVGDVLVLEDTTATVVAPDGSKIALAPDGATERAPSREHVLLVEQPGFYELRDADGTTVRRSVAVNVDRIESDLTQMQPAAIAAAVAPGTGDGSDALRSAAVLTLEERERRQSLWWYVLAAAVALLAGETVLATRPSRALRRGGTS